MKDKHSQDWLDSAVDPDLTRLNVVSLEGQSAPYNHLFISSAIPRINTGRVAQSFLRRYRHIEKGGWWCSGVDPLNDWQPMEWGGFKPDHPRTDETGKLIKYEHPPREKTRIFLLYVPDHIWEKVSARYGFPVADEDRQRGFWHWIWKYNIPITITEGAKKAGCLLTAGYAAIALPGINGGYRTPKDEDGNKTGKSYLIPDLQYFATLGRDVYFCFDHDQKRKTLHNVNKAIEVTGFLFAKSGSTVRVISLPGPEKGVDDFVACRGAEAFDALYQAAQLLKNWQARSFAQLTYPAAFTVNRRYLGDISIPDDAKLVAITSPKGTGKTQFLESVVSSALDRGQWVLVIGHRVQLVEALCHRFGIPYVTEVRSSSFGAALGYGLCIDSLHPGSQARFNAENWHDGVVIFDESEQVIWHALNSSTCQTERVPILRELKTLLCNVLHGGGRVFLADADLSDLSIDFVRSLSGAPVEPWVVVNEWRPGSDECWDIYNYEGKNPSGLVDALESHIADDGKPFVVCSAQKAKSKWGTRTLESHFKNLFPDKQILRIDSETIADPSHPAYGCVGRLDTVLQRYDVVLASPSIETGVSLDLKGHFTSVWGIFQGVQAENSCRQALARLREPVDRHIWAAPYGVGKIGNGSTSVKSVLGSQHKLTRANIKLLQDSALDDIELNFQPESLRTWAKMAVRVNLGMVNYRQAILDGLSAEGHRIIEMGAVVSDSVKAAVTDTRDENHQAEAQAIAASPDILTREFELLQEQKAKTKHERYTERKHSLEVRYGVPVDADLVLKDDDGWYSKLRLHYFLTVGDEFLSMRDEQRLRAQTEKGQGAVWQPDLNKGQTSTAVAVMKNLGISDLINRKPGEEVRATDEVVQRMAASAIANPRDIKTALNISISEKDTPIAIAQKLLKKIGLKLDYLRREGSNGNRIRVYETNLSDDGRGEVFTAWLQRDKVATETFTVSTPVTSTPVTSTPVTSTPGNKEIINSPVDVRGVDASTPVTSTPVTSTPGNKEIINSPVDVRGVDASTPVTSTPVTSTPGNKEIINSPVDVIPLDVTQKLAQQEVARAANPIAPGRVVEILTRCGGQWLSGYFYVGRKGDRHQLADSTGYRGIFVSDNEFRYSAG